MYFLCLQTSLLNAQSVCITTKCTLSWMFILPLMIPFMLDLSPVNHVCFTEMSVHPRERNILINNLSPTKSCHPLRRESPPNVLDGPVMFKREADLSMIHKVHMCGVSFPVHALTLTLQFPPVMSMLMRQMKLRVSFILYFCFI